MNLPDPEPKPRAQKPEISPLDQRLNAMIEEARRLPPKSFARKRILHCVVAEIQKSGRLLKRDQYEQHYEDAVQRMWVYFMDNVCEANTANNGAYDPERAPNGSVISWLNVYLYKRLKYQYGEVSQKKEPNRYAQSTFDEESGRTIDPVDNLVSPIENKIEGTNVIEAIREWASLDAERILCQCMSKTNPFISCQKLILRRLPPEELEWKDLAQEFNAPLPSISNYFRRHCIRLLQEFCRKQGFHD
jgi:hypothetical protein